MTAVETAGRVGVELAASRLPGIQNYLVQEPQKLCVAVVGLFLGGCAITMQFEVEKYDPIELSWKGASARDHQLVQ